MLENAATTRWQNKVCTRSFFIVDSALISAQMAYQLQWGRFVNKKGGKGNNMSCDLRLEHMNRLLKQSLHSVSPTFKQDGANAISRIANSINSCERLYLTTLMIILK